MSEQEDDLDQFQQAAEDRDRLRGQELLRTIDFGIQVQAFLDSEIGQRILTDAEQQAQGLYRALADLDPDKQEDRDQMRHIRQRLGILSYWQDAFAGYILAGRQAELEYQETE